MPLWFAITLGTVTALAAGVSGITAYILISLGRAIPVIRQRVGHQPQTMLVFGREPRRLKFAMAAPYHRRARYSHWANAHH